MNPLAPNKRRGFTLPEVLVSITLIAVLAAVVVPTIAGQIRKSEPTRIGNDLLAIRGASEQFLSDVRRYPVSLGNLTNTIATGKSALVGTTYGNAEVNRWRGPYLNKDSAQADTTGYGAFIKQPFDTMSLAISGGGRAAGILYMLVNVIGVDSSNTAMVDNMFDDGSPLRGSIRWIKGGTGTDTLRYLLLPVH